MTKKITNSLVFFIVLNGVTASFSAPAGKIAGKVTDLSTGLPIASANIVLEGAGTGASCDLDGEYYIINIPPGIYTMAVSAVGYSRQNITGVIVNSGQTTWYDVKLAPAVIVMEAVTVTYEQPPVNIQETSVRSTVRRETIEELPLETIEQVLKLQAGAVTDGSGQLHLRGGRSGEVVYYIDGQKIEDPFEGAAPMLINREAVEELTVLSGTFNAEYGEAMSGVVQIITREGGQNFHAGYEYLSPMVNTSPYRKTDWVQPGSDAVRQNGESMYQPFGLSEEPVNVLPMQGRMHLYICGPVTGSRNTTYFLSSLLQNENSYLPFGYEQNRSGTGKVTHSYGKGGKIAFSGSWGWSNYQNYSHAWKYVPEHFHRHFLRDRRLEVQWVHQLGQDFFFSLHAGAHQQEHDVKIFEDWQDYLDSGYQPEDFTFASYFYDENDWSDTYRESSSISYSAGGEATCQYGNYHQFKCGADARILNLKMLDIREMDIGTNNQPAGIIDRYGESPREYSAYLQDKIELDYLVLNAGLRWDYTDPQSQGWSNPEDPESGLADAPVSQQFSPRLGLAHPINDNISLYFAYGHFFQYPYYQNLFMNSVDLSPDTLAERSFDAVGNRMLKPQRTVTYEVGLKGNLSRNVGFTLTAYYKDITDLVGTKLVRVGTKYNYAMFRNIDYASVVGFEIGLTRRLSKNWSFEGNYAYSVAKGNSSEPLQGFWNAYYQQPEARQEYYLDFDRRHTLKGMMIYQTGKNSFSSGFLNSVLSDVTVGVAASFASGLPYTPYSGAGEQLALTNSARMDASMTVDLRLSKILMRTPAKITLLVYVDNLFDFINDLRVNSETGEPWDAPLVGNDIAFDQLYDPSKVDVPRMIKAGVNVEL